MAEERSGGVDAPETDAGVVTSTLDASVGDGAATVRKFGLQVIAGPDVGRAWQSEGDRCAIGSHSSNELVLTDQTVSRFHCEIRIDHGMARIRDLDSRNGAVVDGTRIADAYLRSGSQIRLGMSMLRFDFAAEHNARLMSHVTEMGSLVGVSAHMRTAFALLERGAASDATVLIEGETGTGKEGAADAVHAASARKNRPFVTVDCSAIAPTLLESELFGHEKGAFTGAALRRLGCFEEADGGTIFLDEIGELPLDLQPKLLRVLEQREVRRLGTNSYKPIDVRVIAATNRDLRGEVNEGRFRSDLYFRLAVVRVWLPSLRERLDDLPLLVERLLSVLGASDEARARMLSSAFLARVRTAPWPGNVRELRNYLERCMVLDDMSPPASADVPRRSAGGLDVDTGVTYENARRQVLDEFERRYVVGILERHGHNVTHAARAANLARAYFHRLMRKHGIKSG